MAKALNGCSFMILKLAGQQEKNTFKWTFLIQIIKETAKFEIERSFLYLYKMFQRIQFPLLPAAAKTI